MGLLPRRRARTSSLAASTGLHGIALAALIWLPALFPSPIFIHLAENKPAAPAEFEPLVMPGLPQLASRGSGSRKSAAKGPGAGSGRARPSVTPEPPKPDYVAPQEIVSVFPKATNRVQTIRRPDLVSPPEMKFPVRLQSMVVLPPPSAPVLTPPPREEPKRPAMPLPTTHEEIPVDEATVQDPALTLTPKRILPVPAEAAPPQTAAANTPAVVEAQVTPFKAVVVVNAVAVPPDPAAAIPNAQLSGNFVVGPSSGASTTEKPSAAGTGRPADGGSSRSGEGSSRAGLESGSGAGSGSGHTPITGSGGTGSGTGTGNGNGSAPGVGGKSGAGGGTGVGSTPGPGSGNGTPGAGSGTGTGISISGGVPGRGATISRAMPVHRSYGMMIISGGSNGGASRDVGVFDRSETVYSVAISMADAGGGPAWTMQYAVLNPAQATNGLLVPPFAQKKVPAPMPKAQFAGETGPVFITGVIDERGKLQSLRSMRPQDARSQPAIRALQQWEFLPAQLDGKAVASKVLIGVTVTLE